VVGYLVCDRVIGPLDRSFLLLTVLNVAALVLLLSRLSGPLQRTLWVWSALFVFVTGTFLKMYWFAWKLNSPAYINSTFAELRWVDARRIIDGYHWATLGFTVFCIAASFVLLWSRRDGSPTEDGENTVLRGNTTLQMVVGLVLAYLVLSLLQLRLNYGVLGLDNPTLPGRIGTLLTFARQQAIPGLLLLAVWLFDHTNRRLASLAGAALIGCAIIDALVSTSRGTVFSLSAPLFLLWVMTKRLNNQRRVAFVAICLTGVVLFPIVSAVRQSKLDPGATTATGLPSFSMLADSSFFILTRPSGIEGVWYAQDYQGRLSVGRTLDYLKPGALTDFYTRSVVRVVAAGDFRAPGIIGALMIIGGSAAVVLLMSATVLGIGLMWAALRRLRTWPVCLALAAPAVAIFVSGGVFDFLSLVKTVLQCLLCEFAYTKLVRAVPEGDIAGMVGRRSAYAAEGLAAGG
jgi:hypothetical protein